MIVSTRGSWKYKGSELIRILERSYGAEGMFTIHRLFHLKPVFSTHHSRSGSEIDLGTTNGIWFELGVLLLATCSGSESTAVRSRIGRVSGCLWWKSEDDDADSGDDDFGIICNRKRTIYGFNRSER
ncbi:hypothetical protein E3N88_39832 [Mikania micrantha]|uniref:Uncharacterized protein n=1 Tax=Mikania micrantha TaxID=192012 RepID=A0A5N6LKX0_9ASTR|nr:hypothetical protein E3N88_39832 [Mikania micrantha]